MPADPALTFRPVRADDYPLLRRWLEAPHMREWWGDPDEELDLIRAMVEGCDSTRPFLIERDGAPVGYIQYWFLGDHQNAEWIRDHPWLAELPADAIGVDLSIGEPDLLSKGIGSTALAAFARRLQAEGHRTIIIDPDPDNTRAVRAYARAGFRPVPHLQSCARDALIMQYHPNANGTT